MVDVQVATQVAVEGSTDGLARRVDRRLLLALALHSGPVHKTVLAGVVWDGDPPPTWETALRGAVRRLRLVLVAAGATDPIRTGAGMHSLGPDVRVDVVEAAATVAAADALWRRGDLQDCIELARSASAVLRHELAVGEDGAWIEAQRLRFAELGRRASALVADAALGLGRWQDAIDACESILDSDPFNEPAYRRTITAWAALGNRAAALRAYQRCRTVLGEELGATPTDATEEAYMSALGAHDGPLEHDPAALTRYLMDSARVEDLRRAVPPAIAAAEVLAERGAHDAAVALLEDVRDRLEALAVHAASERARVHAALMVVRAMTNEVDAARSDLRRAGELALQAGDPGALVGLAGALRAQATPEVDQGMVDLAEQLLALAPLGTTSRVTVLMWLSHELARSREVGRSAALADDAVSQARTLSNDELLRAALQTWHVNAHAMHPPRARANAMEEALRASRSEPRRLLDGLSRAYLAADLVEDGQMDRAVEQARRVQREAGGPPTLRWLGARIDAMVAVATGRWNEAEELIARAEGIAAALGSPETTLLTFTQRSSLAYHRGGLEPFRDLAVALSAAPDAVPLLVASAAHLDAELGSRNEHLATRAVVTTGAMPRWLTYWAARYLAIEAGARVGLSLVGLDVDETAEDLALRAATWVAIPGAALVGPVDRVRALLIAERDPPAASALFSTAADQARSINAPPYLARCLVDHAELLDRHGPVKGAPIPMRLVDEAVDLVERFDLVPLRHRLEQL